jgi:hypothetical protein
LLDFRGANEEVYSIRCASAAGSPSCERKPFAGGIVQIQTAERQGEMILELLQDDEDNALKILPVNDGACN